MRASCSAWYFAGMNITTNERNAFDNVHKICNRDSVQNFKETVTGLLCTAEEICEERRLAQNETGIVIDDEYEIDRGDRHVGLSDGEVEGRFDRRMDS